MGRGPADAEALMGSMQPDAPRQDSRLPAARRTGLARRRPTWCLALVSAAWTAGCTDSDLPALPQPVVDGFAPAVQEQIQAAAARASEHSREAAAVGRLGRILYTYGQYQAARDCFLRSRALDPDRFEWAYLLGVVESDLGRFDEARSAFEAAAGMRPADLPTGLRLADLLERAGDYERSREVLEVVLERVPRSAATRYRLGRLAAGTGAAAIQHLEAALEIEPDYREALYALASRYRLEGRHEEAAEQMERYEQTDPTPRRHYEDPLIDAMDSIRERSAQETFNEGHGLQARGDFEGALAAYANVLEIDPDYAQAHVNLVAVHGELGNHERAAAHYERSVAIDPSIAEAHYNYGVSRHLAGDFSGAADAFEKALAINPQDPNAHGNLGASLDGLGRASEATRHFRLAIEYNPSHPMANFHLGRQLAERGRYREALPYLETAVETETEGTALHAFLLALVHRELGSNRQAEEYGLIALRHARAGGHEDLEARIRAELGL